MVQYIRGLKDECPFIHHSKVVPWVLPSVKKFVAFGYIKNEEKRGEGLR